MPRESKGAGPKGEPAPRHVPCPYCGDTGRVPASQFAPAQRCSCPAGGWTPRPERTPDPDLRPNTRGLILHTARSAPAPSPQLEEPPSCPPYLEGIDVGIRQAVERLQAHGVETFQSCEGGPGHSYPEPTVAFYGGPAAGWRAVAVCLDYGLPVLSLRRVWDVLETNEPTGPYWELTFRQRMV